MSSAALSLQHSLDEQASSSTQHSEISRPAGSSPSNSFPQEPPYQPFFLSQHHPRPQFKSLLPAGSAQQQVLQQQALHQAALHQAALKTHHDLHQNQQQQQQQQPRQEGAIDIRPCVTSLPARLTTPPMDTHAAPKIEPMEVDRLYACSGHYQDGADSCTRVGDGGEVKAIGSVWGPFTDKDPQQHSGLQHAGFELEPQSNECVLANVPALNVECNRLVEAKDDSSSKGGLDDCKSDMKLGRSRLKGLESGVENEIDSQHNGVLASREEYVKGLKADLIHVAHKMPKNAHAHFVLGLMYQRLEQPAKAVSAFQKAIEILAKAEEELRLNKTSLSAAIQCQYAVCMLKAKTSGKGLCGAELPPSGIEGWVKDLKSALQINPCYLLLWNTLGSVLFRAGDRQSAISIFRSLLGLVPDCLEAVGNLGVAYVHSGHLADAARCFQLLLEKDCRHPEALSNYGTLLLRQYGSSYAVAGARCGASQQPKMGALMMAKQCFTAALKADPAAGHVWANLAASYSMLCDFTSARACLEQALKLEPNRLSTRYAAAMLKVHESQFSYDSPDQLSWAANVMVSILRSGHPATIQRDIAWAGLAMVNRAEHETAAAFEADEMDGSQTKARALHTLQQAVEERPNDPMHWHQLGLHALCTLQFKLAEDFLKMAISHRTKCGTMWSNLGIALQLSGNLSLAEEVYQRALSLAPRDQAHTVFSNLGNLLRQQKRFSDAQDAFKKALKLCPNYAPACNNLGLLFVTEGKLDEAMQMFERALLSDPLLDAAKSNKMKVQELARLRGLAERCP